MSTRTHPPVGGGLARLARTNPVSAFVATLVVMLAGLFAPGIIGAGILFALDLGVLALTSRTWRVTAPRARVIRVVVLLGVAVIALVKLD